MGSLQQVLAYTLIPVAATLTGGVVAAVRPPGAQLRSAVQHFAAGVVFAAAAGELLPDIRHRTPGSVALGFALGTALMLTVTVLVERRAAAVSESPLGLLTAVVVDIFLDGLLLGIGFAAGESQGIILTIALTLELLFLGLSVAAALTSAQTSRRRVIGVTAGLTGVLVLGAVVGGSILGRVTGDSLAAVIAFGIAALLYLVTEELLVEAHEVASRPFATAMFFVGFLSLLLVEMQTTG